MNIKPISAEERNLCGIDYFLFWSGVAISLAEIWAGGFLAPLGFFAGLMIIFLGHLIGNTFLGLGGYIGSRHGLSSMTTVRPAFGIRGANLAAVLNIIQLVGWASILLIIAGQAGATLGHYVGGVFESNRFWIVIIGLATLLWAFYTDMKIWKFLQYFACTMLFIVVVMMTIVTFCDYNPIINVSTKPTTLHFMTALDLVIAMPISFLPIIADYSRFAKSNKTAFVNTWIGYFIISSWMYILGLGATIYTGSTDPAMLILKTLSTFGLAIPALMLIVFSTITSNFPDIYSATCSMMNITDKANPKVTMWIITLLTIVVSLFFPMAQYENFLLFIGAMFIPLFGVILTDYFLIKKRKIDLKAIYSTGGKYWYGNGYNYVAISAWIIGFAVFEVISFDDLPFGGSLPSFLISGSIYWILTILLKAIKNNKSK
jgi:nucleobase:cation symporter-1, NCS1 family